MGKHYVPQKYLSGFATGQDDSQIWMYDKERRQWSRAAISMVAQERDYFDPETESALARAVERPAHEVLAKLRRHQPLAAEERAALALYTSVMLMRVPQRRRKARELVEPTLREVVERIRSQMSSEVRSAEDHVRLQEHLRTLEHLEVQYAIAPPPEVVKNIESPWPSERVFGAVIDMTWRFVVSSGPSYFLTSDNPAFFFEAYGLATPLAELTFPLCRDIALLGSWQGTSGASIRIEAKHTLVKEINRRVASGAERFLFYHQPAKWVETLANRQSPYLSRIEW